MKRIYLGLLSISFNIFGMGQVYQEPNFHSYNYNYDVDSNQKFIVNGFLRSMHINKVYDISLRLLSYTYGSLNFELCLKEHFSNEALWIQYFRGYLIDKQTIELKSYDYPFITNTLSLTFYNKSNDYGRFCIVSKYTDDIIVKLETGWIKLKALYLKGPYLDIYKNLHFLFLKNVGNQDPIKETSLRQEFFNLPLTQKQEIMSEVFGLNQE